MDDREEVGSSRRHLVGEKHGFAECIIVQIEGEIAGFGRLQGIGAE
jgi:hypothetical protein